MAASRWPDGLRPVEWVDLSGRHRLRGLPAGVPDSEAEFGVPLGPPPLDELDLPDDVLLKLHNELYSRAIISASDAQRRRSEVAAAVATATRDYVFRVIDLYSRGG